MCIIVDANLCSIIFKDTKDVLYKDLRNAIFHGRLTLIHGGKLSKEYERAGVLLIIALLSQKGRAYKVSDQLIDKEFSLINKFCSSDDGHVIALARADRSHARLLCSNDKDLRKDFQNKKLIDKPRGKIYSPTRHLQSLKNC